MDRVAVVLRYQWLAYWRCVQRADSMTKANTGILIVLGGMVVVRYLQYFAPLETQLAQQKTVLYEHLLSAIFFVWLLPVLSESRRSLTPKNLIHCPLTIAEQFAIRFSSVFVAPISWAVGLCSLALLVPLTAASNVIAGATALLLCLLIAMSVSLLLADLVAAANPVRLSLAAAGVIAVMLADQSVTWPAGFRVRPPGLAAYAAVAPAPLLPVIGLSVLAGIALSLCIWNFAHTLRVQRERASGARPRRAVFRLPGRLGVLVQRDLRLFRRWLDLYLVVPILIVSAIYLVGSPAPSANAPAIMLLVIFVPLSSLVFNCFGFETTQGFDRYALLPLTGRDILLVKNIAVSLVMTAAFVAVIPLALWRVGVAPVAASAVTLVLLGFAYLSWGNWMSVARPCQMQPYRLSSGGPIVEAVLGVLFGSVPGILAIVVLVRGRYSAIVLLVVLLPIYVLVYLRSLIWAGRRLETQRTAIRSRLS